VPYPAKGEKDVANSTEEGAIGREGERGLSQRQRICIGETAGREDERFSTNTEDGAYPGTC